MGKVPHEGQASSLRYLVVHDCPEAHDADVDIILGVAHPELGDVSRAPLEVRAVQHVEGGPQVALAAAVHHAAQDHVPVLPGARSTWTTTCLLH